MNGRCILPLLLLGRLPGSPARAASEGPVTITSPKDGAVLDALDENRLVYEVEPGPRGDHVHVYLDGKEAGILRKLNGSYLLETLSPGKHELCVKIANKAHVPIGVGQCIRVSVK